MVGLMGLVASTDGPLILCWTLASWSLWRAQLTNPHELWAVRGLICGIGIMDKYTMAAFAITAIWTLWGVRGPSAACSAWAWVTIAVAALVVSPNIWWNAETTSPRLNTRPNSPPERSLCGIGPTMCGGRWGRF